MTQIRYVAVNCDGEIWGPTADNPDAVWLALIEGYVRTQYQKETRDQVKAIIEKMGYRVARAEIKILAFVHSRGKL